MSTGRDKLESMVVIIIPAEMPGSEQPYTSRFYYQQTEPHNS
jgi:hypothetical protein